MGVIMACLLGYSVSYWHKEKDRLTESPEITDISSQCWEFIPHTLAFISDVLACGWIYHHGFLQLDDKLK